MKLKTLFVSILAVCALTACEDLFEVDNLKPDGSIPSMTVHTPFSNQAVSTSQGLHLNMTLVDKDLVKEFEVSIRGDHSNKDLLKFTKYPSKNVVEFDSTFSFVGAAPGNYTLYIKAVDKRTNMGQRFIKFQVK